MNLPFVVNQRKVGFFMEAIKKQAAQELGARLRIIRKSQKMSLQIFGKMLLQFDCVLGWFYLGKRLLNYDALHPAYIL